MEMTLPARKIGIKPVNKRMKIRDADLGSKKR